MPATYAHKRFGEKVLESLPKELSEAFSAHLSEYYLGLHGPDLLFYYRPLTKNPVNRDGLPHARTTRGRFFRAHARAHSG